MQKSAVALSLLLLVAQAFGQQPETSRAEQPAAQTTAAPQDLEGFISPSEVNVRIEPDVRTFVVMAAINIAGFDYETGGQPLSPARAELRRDLAGLDPQIKAKLAAYYKSHRRAGVDEASDAARYAALSLLMTQPPSFSIYQRGEGAIPADLRPLLDFVPLVQEFYIKGRLKELAPKYLGVADAYAKAYRRPVGETIYQAVDYFHAKPETIINMRPMLIGSGEQDAKSKKEKQNVITRTRTRQVYVIPDPLTAMDTSFVRGDILNLKDDLILRKAGDDYIVVIGPSKTASVEAVRQALIRFVIDPIVERHLKNALEYKEPIINLVAAVPAAAPEFRSSVYLIIRESLAQAAEARMRRIQATQRRAIYSEDDAVFDLSQAYLRGAVLAFHFYDSLTGLEKVGISIEDFFDQMIATTKFEREAQRPKEFAPVVARVSAARKSEASKSGGAESARAEPMSSSTAAIAKKILQSDDLIRQRQFLEAKSVLEEVLAQQPGNARALFGMAQIINQTPGPVELDAKADENDKIQAQHDRLEQAIKFYKKAIERASAESERWLIQWSHVLIGRILDFQEFRADAIAEYEKAIALGEIPSGAYKEALEGKQRPFGQN